MTEHPPTLTHYLGVLRRRKWLILLPLLLAPATAFLLTQQQTPEYRATSQVLLNRQDIVSAIIAEQPNSAYLDPERLLATQSDVARSPILLSNVVRAANVEGLTESALGAQSQISPHANADVLEFAVTDEDPEVAARLASVY